MSFFGTIHVVQTTKVMFLQCTDCFRVFLNRLKQTSGCNETLSVTVTMWTHILSS